MLLASWNLNSIRAREERLLAWLERRQPDVVCLQELKCTEDQFPFEAIEAAGYQAIVHGQKTYNGVAILSKSDPTDVSTGFGDDGDESQARVIAATIDGVRIISVYIVNGGEIDSGKYAYKLKWLKRLENYLAAQDCTAQLAICGDYNIVPDERDVKNPKDWWGGVLYNKDLDAWFKRLIDLGLQDTLRIHHKEAGIYSWWDYRMLGFPKNNGLRIDLILATSKLAARSADAGVDRDERKGKKPSDHAPVFAEFHD